MCITVTGYGNLQFWENPFIPFFEAMLYTFIYYKLKICLIKLYNQKKRVLLKKIL